MLNKTVLALLAGLSFSSSLAAQEELKPLGLNNPLEAAGYCRDAALVVTDTAANLADRQDYSLISPQDIFSLSLKRTEIDKDGVDFNASASTASIITVTSIVISLMADGYNPKEESARYYLLARSAAECMTTSVN